MIRRPPRSTLFPTRRSSDLGAFKGYDAAIVLAAIDAHRSEPTEETERPLRTVEFERIVGAPDEQPGNEPDRSEEHTSELQSPCNIVCRLLLEKKKNPAARATRLSTRPCKRPEKDLRRARAQLESPPWRS